MTFQMMGADIVLLGAVWGTVVMCANTEACVVLGGSRGTHLLRLRFVYFLSPPFSAIAGPCVYFFFLKKNTRSETQVSYSQRPLGANIRYF